VRVGGTRGASARNEINGVMARAIQRYDARREGGARKFSAGASTP
jgi:hypothetical protein